MKWSCVLLAVALVGCVDNDRLTKLEKQNQELQAEINKRKGASLEQQAKCSRDAKSWQQVNFPPDKDTIFMDETNHYNDSMNKCFVRVQWNEDTADPAVERAWIAHTVLYDVYENVRFGEFDESNIIYKKNTNLPDVDQVYSCNVGETKCKTVEEFNSLASRYMNN